MASVVRYGVTDWARRGANGRRSSNSCAGRSRLLAVGVALGALLSLLPAAGGVAGPTVPAVAVADFYAPTPVPTYAGLVPEEFAAADLSEMLARVGEGRLVPIPRATVQRAEGDLRWRADDALHFARLGALAQTLHADRLVVGWIAQFVVGHEPNGGIPFHGGGPITGFAVVVVQVFDAAEGRIMAETRAEGTAQGGLNSLVAEQTLHQALQPTISFLLSTLTSPRP